MASTSDAALKAEIARLTGAINQHRQRSRPSARTTQGALSTRDVVIDGVTFESSSRSLVRKGLTMAPSVVPLKQIRQQRERSRTTHGYLPAHRAYKPKVSSRTQLHRPRNRNMTLDNTRRPTQSVHHYNSCGDFNLIVRHRGRLSNKRMKYLNKPCPRFTTTGAFQFASSNVLSSMQADPFSRHGCSGACSRGLTCMYQHDPNKIAICWNFLHGNCPNTAQSCNLSHDPIPERTPLCVHFANNGRCTREKCPFPHVRVGQRHGICRDFAVLGYCSQGLDCQMQHVRECPDFAEKGACSTKGCKLPHVIRANCNRKMPTSMVTTKTGTPSLASGAGASKVTSDSDSTSDNTSSSQQISIQDAQLGDEYISLMFNESEEESDDDSDDDATDAEDENASDEEEGVGPT